MMHFLPGIIVLLFSSAGYLSAFRFHKYDKAGYALFFLVLSGFVLRAYTASDTYLHNWDERYHALVAKHLMHHFLRPTLYEESVLSLDYKNWTFNHIWLHKQPLALWLMAISLKIFGIHPWAVRIPSVILSTVGIKLMYDIAKYLYDKNTAFIAAFLFSIHGLIIELGAGRTDTDHVDVIFLFFVLLGLSFSVKYLQTKGSLYCTVLIGFSIGAAILTKWLPGIVILPIWLALSYSSFSLRKIMIDLFLVFLIAALIALPWQIYIFCNFPLEARWEYLYNKRHFFEPLEGHSGNFLYHINSLRIIYGELIYLPVVWFLYRAATKRRINDIAVSSLFLIPYIFYSVAATKMPAYTLIACPAIFIITGEAYYFFQKATSFPKVLRVIAVCLILLPIRYSFERIKLFDTSESNELWNSDIEKFALSNLNTKRTIIFNCPHYVEMMFKSNCTCYSETADKILMDSLVNKRYKVVVLP